MFQQDFAATHRVKKLIKRSFKTKHSSAHLTRPIWTSLNLPRKGWKTLSRRLIYKPWMKSLGTVSSIEAGKSWWNQRPRKIQVVIDSKAMLQKTGLPFQPKFYSPSMNFTLFVYTLLLFCNNCNIIVLVNWAHVVKSYAKHAEVLERCMKRWFRSTKLVQNKKFEPNM